MENTIRKSARPQEPWETIHPLSPDDSASMTALRSMVAGMKGKLAGVSARGPFDGIMEHVATPDGVAFEAGTVGGISGWWAKPARARTGSAMLHLHGGWFNWGSALSFCNLVGNIARSAGTEAFIPDYRLAPEHPFPAAVKDADPLASDSWSDAERLGVDGLAGYGRHDRSGEICRPDCRGG